LRNEISITGLRWIHGRGFRLPYPGSVSVPLGKRIVYRYPINALDSFGGQSKVNLGIPPIYFSGWSQESRDKDGCDRRFNRRRKMQKGGVNQVIEVMKRVPEGIFIENITEFASGN